MAVNPNTTNLAVKKEIAEKLRSLAKANDMTTMDVTNQLLDFALSQVEIKVEVKTMTLKIAEGGKKKPPGKK